MIIHIYFLARIVASSLLFYTFLTNMTLKALKWCEKLIGRVSEYKIDQNFILDPQTWDMRFVRYTLFP